MWLKWVGGGVGNNTQHTAAGLCGAPYGVGDVQPLLVSRRFCTHIDALQKGHKLLFYLAQLRALQSCMSAAVRALQPCMSAAAAHHRQSMKQGGGGREAYLGIRLVRKAAAAGFLQWAAHHAWERPRERVACAEGHGRRAT